MLNNILSTSRNKLIFYRKGIFVTSFSFCKLILSNSDGRLTRIIGRIILYLRCDRITGGCYGIAILKVVFCKLKDLAAYFDPVLTVHIEIVYSEFIGINRFEHSNGIETFCDLVSSFNSFLIIFIFPVIKHLTFDKRIIRKGRNSITHSKVNEILRFLAYDISVLIFDDKVDPDLAFKKSIESQIFINRRSGSILCSFSIGFGKPSNKSCTVLYRFSR